MANLAVRRRLQPAGGVELNHKRCITAQLSENMKTALVKIDYPYGKTPEAQQPCNALLNALEERAKTTKGIQSLDRTVWLIDVHTQLNILAWLLTQAQTIGVESHTAFFEESLVWIPKPPQAS